MKKAEQTKSVYILLTDTGTLFSRTIKLFTAAPYNHVSISLDQRLDELYSFGRKHPKNPLYAGFVKEDVYNGIYRYFQNTRCILFELCVTDQQLDQIKQMIRSFEAQQEIYMYNLVGLFGVMVNYPIELKNAYFCSQFVAEVLKRSGIQLWDKPSALVTPNDFLQHPSFKFIYEGRLYEYSRLQSELISFYEPLPLRRKFSLFPYKKIRRFFI
ncbi:hypothetical protein ACFO25_15725 [Paenactinomyces guangxiensis]|uniref:Uncharacterized protein n=1 Tax=Paenactinomyces guangxiensis TaxID=1490290 RepID=A0A7W1WUD0_9BACL|nr:hypothetical protein [Paenactinomyces guangxiensis]MBA4496031.1 hypothetical protein [Paenactinomyces guangxiensis]MBH8593093.1 hypothetical protein [Paenactinomyces guangxiensis]